MYLIPINIMFKNPIVKFKTYYGFVNQIKYLQHKTFFYLVNLSQNWMISLVDKVN